MYILLNEIYFPLVSEAHESGILAFGGDLSTKRLLLAYNSGIFPWYEECEPITWYAPEYRMVLPLSVYKPKKSVRNLINRNIFNCTINQDFEAVIRNCQQIKREGQNGTWITDEIIEAYNNLHKLGKTLSVEVWQDGELVGGLYGIAVGRIFCGESMFSKVSNASKIGFDFLVNYLKSKDFVLYPTVDNAFYTWDELKEKAKINQTNKDGKTVLLYTSNKDAQHSYIANAKAKGYEVLLLDSPIVSHLIQKLEMDNQDVTFSRVDSDSIDNLIKKDEEVISKLSETETTQLKEFIETTIANKSYNIQTEALDSTAAPFMITQPEFMRRM